MLKIPYGISDYKKIKEDGYYYVDKTMYLEKLEEVGSVLTYLRPGRYGKTLFTSMLSYYYDVNAKSEFQSLFKNTYVSKNPTRNKNNYYILKFDFSGLTTSKKDEQVIETEFIRKVADGIQKFNDTYKVNARTDYHDITPNGLLLEFLSYFRSLDFEHKLYILIDEYDNFTNAILEGTGDKFRGVVGNEGFVKNFYAIIKEYCGLGIVDRVFITGICPITLDSMTTGFNVAIDISRDIEFNSMIGLTHEEVKKLLLEIEAKNQEQLFDIMVKNYDGYLFHKNAESRIFNATLVMYFLNYYNRFFDIPEELIDTNIAFNYGKLGNLLRLQENSYYLDIIDSLLKSGEITGELKRKFNLEEDFMRDDIISLLYYFGYLTIGEALSGGRTKFVIPNYVMSNLYYDYFLSLLSKKKVVVDRDLLSEGVDLLKQKGDITTFVHYVESFIRLEGKRTLIKFDERYIQLYFSALLRLNGEYQVYSEYEVKNGYVDLMLFKGNNPTIYYEVMIELKYIPVKEYKKNRKLLLEKKEEAILQLNSYQEDERINKEILKKYVIIFVGQSVKIVEEV